MTKKIMIGMVPCEMYQPTETVSDFIRCLVFQGSVKNTDGKTK